MKDKLQKVLASWFYVGYFPVASGTAGTAAAIPFYLLVLWCLHQVAGGTAAFWAGYAVVTIAFILLSIWAAGCGKRFWDKEDAGQIVIDEVAGYMVTMFLVPFSWGWVIAGFFAFRVFDIVKPPPARQFDRDVQGGLGVTMDDVAAGVYACLTLHIVRVIFF